MTNYNLAAHDYVFNMGEGYWHRPTNPSINYSDGDAVEQRIEAIINSVGDLSVTSIELKHHCTDWPSLYHLSSKRSNILRPLESIISGDVLEVGSGCGAITRYLGECNANILSLEGSKRRAAITRSRTRDLNNVCVVADSFEQFTCSLKFDIVTLIGVLEYASLFIENEDPTLAMLERCRSFLKPNGILIIAIENQLGLKYFAGAPEDHIGVSMYGVEDRYKGYQPRTFGRLALSNKLRAAGYSRDSFLAAFPDYKLASSIITSEGLTSEHFDASSLILESVRSDPQLPNILAFSPELAWPIIVENMLSLDMANSFLVMATCGSKCELVSSDIFAWHFATNRNPMFCKINKFVKLGNTTVECKRIHGPQNGLVRGKLLSQNIENKAVYIEGSPLSSKLLRIVIQDDWKYSDICGILFSLLGFLESVSKNQKGKIDLSSPYSKVNGFFLDFITQNIIVTNSGGFNLIDTEWTYNEDLEIGYIVLRSLLSLLCRVTRFGKRESGNQISYLQFIFNVFDGLGWPVLESDIEKWLCLEGKIQREVTGDQSYSLELISTIKSLTLQYNNLSSLAPEREQQISQATNDISLLNQQITSIYSSRSWKMTAPLRMCHEYIKKARRVIVGLLSCIENRP